jgi:hypothetical protein
MKVIINELHRVYRPLSWKYKGVEQSSANAMVKKTKDIHAWMREDIEPYFTDIVWYEDLMTDSEIAEWNKGYYGVDVGIDYI